MRNAEAPCVGTNGPVWQGGLWRAAAVAVLLSSSATTAQRDPGAIPLEVFAQAASSDRQAAERALETIAAGWKNSYAALLLDLAELNRLQADTRVAGTPSALPTRAEAGGPTREPAAAAAPVDFFGDEAPSPRAISPVRERIFRFLEKRTGQRFGHDFARWHQWIWSLPYDPHPDLALFKGLLYQNIDPGMRAFFPPKVTSLIRLDEVEWGGVTVNGIPPLVYPKHLAAAEAGYLKDDHLIFGIAVNGETRAYPKRILGWHELARDRVGGVELTIVYCTLCGTVIPYDSVTGGKLRVLGTSGLLYRSNKLMFDEETRSLWSTLEGKPVIGSLAGSGITLRPRAAVTTTWGEWRRKHPNTTVLSLDTGHRRDYAEGAAYRDYFATDRLMFTVPSSDRRLKNKDEVLVMRLESRSGKGVVPVAIAADFLKSQPLYHADVAGWRLVVITSRNGANRVYESGDARFSLGPGADRLRDAQGTAWTIAEDALVAEGAPARRLARVAAQRAFWFGWHAQYPTTLLIR